MDVIQIRANKMASRIDKTLGFDKYGEGRFPGTKTVMPPFKLQNGNYRHGVPDGEDRRIIESQLLGGESLDSETGREFLKNCLVELGSDITFFDKNNPESLLKYYIARAANDIVAPSRADVKEKSMSSRQYVIEDFAEVKKEQLSIKQKVNKARAKLSELETSPNYMVALAKYLAPSNAGIKTEDQAYDWLDELLKGKYTDDSELVGTNRFFSALDVDKEILYVSADVKEAIYKNIIRKQGGVYVNPISKTSFGRTEDEVVIYLSQDMNQEELGTGTGIDKPYAIRYQLNQKNNYK